MNQSTQDSWWHERETRPSELTTLRPRIELYRRESGVSVWMKAAMVVGLMVALIATVIGAAAR